MKRIALYSDIHANAVALDAVLEDMSRSGVDARYCLGDLVGYGPSPSEVIDRVRRSGDPVIQGNYDRGVGGRVGDCGCYYATEQAKRDGAASYDFTVKAISDSDATYLDSLTSDVRLEYEDARILMCHGSPRRINEYLMPDRPASQLLRLAGEAEADVVCCGHVHMPYHRVLRGEEGDVHYINAGSVGKPKDGDLRACWVELVLGNEHEITRTVGPDAIAARVGRRLTWAGTIIHRVGYEVEAVAAAMHDAGLPDTLAEALRRPAG